MLLRAGLHNPQGRTLALLALLAIGPEDVLASHAARSDRHRRHAYEALRAAIAVTIIDETHSLWLHGLDTHPRMGPRVRR
jgi:hypothetical protein